MTDRGERLMKGTLVLLGCAVVALLMNWTRTFPLDGLDTGFGAGYVDHGQFVWNLRHAAESVLRGENVYTTNELFYPVGANLAAHTGVPGFFPVTILVKWVSGDHLLYPVMAYHIVRVLCYTLLLFFMLQALRALGHSWRVSCIAATGFAFGDFFMCHWLHLNHLAGFFAPLVAWLSIRAHQAPSRARVFTLAAVTGLAVYFTELALFIVMFFVIFVAVAMCWRRSREDLLAVAADVGPTAIVGAALLFVGVVAPFLIQYAAADVLPPEEDWFEFLGANLMGYVIPAPRGSFLYGDAFAELSRRIKASSDGYEIFLGFPLLLASLASLKEIGKPFVRTLWVVLAVFALLSFGLTLKVFGTDTGIAMPYAWLMEVPPFDQNRAPVRFGVMVLLAVALLAAEGLEVVRAALEPRLPHAVVTAFLALVLAWVVLETYQPLPFARESLVIPAAIGELPEGPVMNVPVTHEMGSQSFYQTLHRQPITYGYLARTSQRQRDLVRELELAVSVGGARLRETLDRYGIRSLFVSKRLPFVELEALREMPVPVVTLHPQGRELVAALGETAAVEGRVVEARPGAVRTFELPSRSAAFQLDLLAQANDRYAIDLFDGVELVGSLEAPRINPGDDLAWRTFELSGELRARAFDRVVVRGSGGDGRHAIAAVVLSRR